MLPSMKKKIFIYTEETNLITIDEKTAVLINQAPKKIHIQRCSTDWNELFCNYLKLFKSYLNKILHIDLLYIYK